MSLLEEARTLVRVCSDKTDAEIQLYLDAALADMRRVGVRSSLLDPESLTPLAKMAAFFYVEANYGHDNAKEFGIWWDRYLFTVTSLMNSSANECDETVNTDESTTEEDGGDTEGGDTP